MDIDLLLSVLVVGAACFFVIRRLLKPGGGCTGSCSCSSRNEPSDIVDLRNKDNQE